VLNYGDCSVFAEACAPLSVEWELCRFLTFVRADAPFLVMA
jgi:hypothetical protein